MNSISFKSIAIAGTLLSFLLFPAVISAQTSTPSATPTVKPGLRDRIKDNLQTKIQAQIRSRATISSGKLTAKNGTTLTVEENGKTYTVLTDANTQYRRRFWGKSDLDELQVGDLLNVIGSWTNEDQTTIKAKHIRDLSIQMRHGVFIGDILTLSGNTWTVKTENRGNQTVTVSSSTKFTNRKEETIAQSEVKVGHRVKVKGLWNKDNNTITEVVYVKDFSLPMKNTPTPSPTP